MPPFRVFVSSPMRDNAVYPHGNISVYRKEIMSAARYAQRSGQFEFFFFEQHENIRVAGRTICQSIFENSGIAFDAFFFFFRDHVGTGTQEELDFFESTILPANPACELWWTQVDCDQYPEYVANFIGRLQNYNTGLRVIEGEELINSPHVLKGRFTAKVFEVSGQLNRAQVIPQ